jgi:hypothetical protein
MKSNSSLKKLLLSIGWVSDFYQFKAYERLYKNMLQKSTLSPKQDKTIENIYLLKWKKISNHVSVNDFRLFARYIGEDPNIVPEYVLHNVIEPVFLPKAYRQFYNDKNMYDKLLPKSFLAESLFRCIDGICCSGDYSVVTNCNEKKLFDLCSKYEKIIIKPTRDTGNGSKILLYKRDGDAFLPMGHDQRLSVDSLISYYDGNFVIQEYLIQSSFTAQFNPTSVNTFRVFTYKSVKTNDVHVLGIVFRMGKENTYVDNNHAGGRYIGVLHDGSFANKCVFDQFGNTYTEFNNIDFSKANFVVPNIRTVIDFSKAVAERIFHNRTLDLDVMIDQEGKPKLIEYNVDMCSPWLYQFTTGTVYGDFTDEVIEYIKGQINK